MSTGKRIFISFKFSDSKSFANALAASLRKKNFIVDICTDPEQNDRSIFEFEQKITSDDFVIFIMTNPWALSFDCAYEASLWFSSPSKNPLNCICYVAPDFKWDFFNNSFDVKQHIFDHYPDRVKNAENLSTFYMRQKIYNAKLVDAADSYLNCIRKYYPDFLAQVRGVGMRTYQQIKSEVFTTADRPVVSFDVGTEMYEYVESLAGDLDRIINDKPKPRPQLFAHIERRLESSPVWLPDAEDAKQSAEVRYRKYYENVSVKNFLSDHNLLCISSVKGIGKTFLLQIKRSTISTDEDQFLILPIGKPSASNDWGTARIAISNNYKIRSLYGPPWREEPDFEYTYKNFEFLWSITIKAYIICQYRYVYDQSIQYTWDLWMNIPLEYNVSKESYLSKDKDRDSDLGKLDAIIDNNSDRNKSFNVNLTHLQETIIKKISEYKPESRRSILELWDDELGEALNQRYFRKYTCNFALFIDKVDAAFDYLPDKIKRGDSASASIFLVSDIYQFSLYTTARKLKEATRKIFVYHAIREETFLRMKDTLHDSYGKVLSSLCHLTYTKEDLEGIFRTTVELQDDKYFLSSKENDIDPIERFLGVPALQHPCCYDKEMNGEKTPIQESLFECINRHSFGATRDLQYFGMKLSAVTCSQRNTFSHMPLPEHVGTIKQTIEDAAASLLFDECCAYIPRKKDLMPDIYVGEHSDFEPLKTLLEFFDRNFLSKKDIDAIKKKFNKKYSISAHPISTLYRLGLLGILVGDGSRADYYIQQFADPYQIGYFDDVGLERIKKANFYLLHPAVTKFLIRENASSFYRFNGFIIGRDYRVNGSTVAKIQSYFQTKPDITKNEYYSRFSPTSPIPCAINN